ncbi:FAR1-related sequence 5-like protein [Tanacetum coccineum]|uniref:FAR1-related sequence 5-like protein n=1 Tax=Tanacetum coccineum TaxID=301880 RepID=A0ABQ5IF73_9ASTR
MVVFDLNQPASSLSEEDDLAASSSINAVFDSHVVSVSSSINTGCDSFASHDEIASLLRTVYDSLDECIEMYRKYASEADPKKNDRQVRSSNFKVCGCKARVLFDMVPHTTKYTLTTFDVEHNHELDRVEYRHLSKAKRRLTYNEQLFIIKAVNANIGAVRAHNLYTSLKVSSSLVHGTQTEFKNFTRGVNCFIEDSDAQMLITRMKERQKYKMVFVPFTAIDNHRRSATVGSGLLKKETTEAYG